MSEYKDYEHMILIPINSEDIINYSILYNDVIALYKTDDERVINVGYPHLQSYIPMLANMYGYNDSNMKHYFKKINREDINKEVLIRKRHKSAFEVFVSQTKTVVFSRNLINNETLEDAMLDIVSLPKTEKQLELVPRYKQK